MDTDNSSSSDVPMSPSTTSATTTTASITSASPHTTSTTTSSNSNSRAQPPQCVSSSATRSPPRLPTTATINPRSGSTTPTQQSQNPSPQRSSSLSPRIRELRGPATSSSGSSSSSSGSSGVYGSSQSNGVLDAKPSSQLALMLSTALEELDTLKSRYSEEKQRADYWEGLARSFKVIEEAYSAGSGAGSSGSPGHDRSPRFSTSSTSSQQQHAPDISTYPPAVVELVSSLHQARYNAECARDDEHARRLVITDLWRQLRDYLDALERHARDAKLAFDRRAVGLNNGEPIDTDRSGTTSGGILVETQRPIPSLRDLEGAGFVYDEKGRIVNRSGHPLPVGLEPLIRFRSERGPPDASPFASTAMGPPTLPPFTTAPEPKSHRKRRSGSIEGGHHGHSGHAHKKSRVNNYLPPPQPLHPPSHSAQPFNLPQNTSSAPDQSPNLSSHPSHSRPSPQLTHIPPPPPPQQHYGDARPPGKSQGQFVPWHPPGHPTFSARDLERDRQERERGRPSSLPRESRERVERGRARSRSASSDKSLDDMILDATASTSHPDQPEIAGTQLPPLRYTPGSGGGVVSTKRRSSRERDERERDYHQPRSPPSNHHYLPPPGGPKMYTHPPPPLPQFQGRDVFVAGEGRSGDRPGEGVVRAGENGQGDPHHPSFSSSHASHHPHALTAHPTIPNGQSLSSLPSSSLTSSHATTTTSSHPSIQTSSSTIGSQSSLVQPGSYPPTNSQGQRICRQCGQAGRYKDGKCVEKWGPGPHGPGTVCDRCRKKMKRVERRGTIEQAQAVAAAQAQAARQQAAAQARAEAARMVAEAEQRERMEERERGRPIVAKDRMMLTRNDTVIVPPADAGASPGSFSRRDREREYSPLGGRLTPLMTGTAGELAPPRTIVPAPGPSTSYRGNPLPPRSSSLRPSSRRSESRSGSAEDVDLDAEGDLDDGDGDGDPESPEVYSSEAGGERDLTGPQRTRSRGGSGGSTESRRSGGSGVVVGVRREVREQEDPEADILEAIDAAEQSVKSE
ncbi:hypothetical protein E1B28_010609 [Marasmius oreades]|uniref:Uncharacterized protein n=1 Tax=Marasmius oreades TaxID=181124 RepID=A0A9P7RYY7_9AGAR|nr:uncharacterized protein E1B28_010609 [Marasmius oreades]KAG7091588.1 hypothetical protein E1B28_010609 [Marasmius oreades]